ncbi:MAG: HlyD family efflux transporter periplasmic adaptor subunit [Oligoflexia bacterium]|nr:HlyD family efflux transporter periplasmic adaptor subunit [Oligoflexia bacterium]
MKYLLALLLLAIQPSSHALEQKPQIPTVFIRPAAVTDLFEVLTYPARVSAKINATLLAETDGVVTRILAPLGQRVTRGQRILTITHTDPIYQYAPATITAPICGIVSAIEVTEGSQVAKGSRVAAVLDPSKVKIQAEVPAPDLAALKRGLTGEFRVGGREKPLPVRIHGLSPFVDPATGTATCEIELLSAEALAPGGLGQVSFKVNSRKGITLPDHAIGYQGSNPYVRIVEGGKAKRVSVVLGSKQQGLVEVLKGVPENAAVIERSSRFVADGDEVKVEGSAQ